MVSFPEITEFRLFNFEGFFGGGILLWWWFD